MSDHPQTTPAPDADLVALMEKGNAALHAGDHAAAERFFLDADTRAPNNPAILHNLGLAYFKADNMQQAEAVLTRVAGMGALPESLMVLAEIFETSGRKKQALICYNAVLKTIPTKYNALMKAAAVHQKFGDEAAAREHYRRAMEARPKDVDATLSYAGMLWDSDPESCVRLAEELLPDLKDDLRNRSRVLVHVAPHKEWFERIKRKQEPFHASRLDELFFTYARHHIEDIAATNEAYLAANPPTRDALIGLGIAKFCLGDRQAAEGHFRGAATKGHMFETVRFAPQFYDTLRTLSDEALAHKLPPLIRMTPMAPNPLGTLYLSCNFTYFQAFALPMLVSLRDRSSGTPVHVHIMDATPEETSYALAFLDKLSPLKFALSIERPGLQAAPVMEARCYYHAVRFIRFFEHLELYGTPLWLMDVDAIVNRDLGTLFSTLGDNDVAMRIRPGRLEPWNQFNACMVGANTTPTSMAYFRLIAGYIARFHQNKMLRWGIDQLAMYGVFADMQDRGEAPSLALLGEKEVDYNYREDGYVWSNSGAGKLRHLERLRSGAAPALPPTSSKFDELFECYWEEVVRITQSLKN